MAAREGHEHRVAVLLKMAEHSWGRDESNGFHTNKQMQILTPSLAP